MSFARFWICGCWLEEPGVMQVVRRGVGVGVRLLAEGRCGSRAFDFLGQAFGFVLVVLVLGLGLGGVAVCCGL